MLLSAPQNPSPPPPPPHEENHSYTPELCDLQTFSLSSASITTKKPALRVLHPITLRTYSSNAERGDW